MAQSVSKDDSPGRVQGAARRHVRLTKRTKNARAIEIAQRIEAPAAVLEEKNRGVESARRAVEDALDDWIADDRDVDDKIASVSRRCVDYDAEHPGARTHVALFRGVAPSDVKYLPRAEQPDEVVKIIARASALPPEHPVVPLIPALAEANERARASQRAYEAALTALDEANAAAEVAKMAVVQVYRDNVIDITRAVGEELAERCFPRLRAPRRRRDGGEGGGEGA
ncbi:MAG TPA: hypothetical protein VIL20_14965 [Sandaracinaceae bacterium]